MIADIGIELERQVILAQENHPFHAQIGRDRVEQVGSGADISLRTDGQPPAAVCKALRVNAVVRAGSGYVPAAVFGVGPGENMTEQQIADNNISQKDGRNRLRQTGVTAIDMGAALLQGGGTGFPVAFPALRQPVGITADQTAERRDMLRPGGQFFQPVVEYGNPYLCQHMKILQQ